MSDEPAAFKASYADFKLIKTRGVVSISFELPVEQAQSALDVLGGMPVAATEVWCGIARIKPEIEVMQVVGRESSKSQSDTSPRSRVEAGAKKWDEMTLCAQAHTLCNDQSFIKFMREETHASLGFEAEYVKTYCGVSSRSQLARGTESGDRWASLVSRYRAWMANPDA
jgi:hypothetical protein